MSQLPKEMHGVVLTGHGGFEQLEYLTNIPVPSPNNYEVIVQVGAAGVNNTDINTRTAWYSKSDSASEDASWSGAALNFPRIQGADVCGVIVAVGKDVNEDRIGDRVLIEPCIVESNGERLDQPWYFGSECNGGFAEYTVVSSRHAHKVQSSLSDVELASFPCSYSTAENLLTKSRVETGETVLITGASGGVGSAAIQLAKARGANVIAITSPEKSAEINDLGATKIIKRDECLIEVLGKNSVDVVVDLVAGKKWPDLLEVLKPGGRYAVAGAIGGPIVELDIRTLYLKDLSLFGCTVLEPNVFTNLIAHIQNGSIKPIVALNFPLEKIVEAQKAFIAKKHTGKIVLSVRND